MQGGKKLDLTGVRSGRLRAVRETDERKGTWVLWECECDCGNTTKVASVQLQRQDVKSCGCLRGRKPKVNHNNRDCREAVTLALYLARLWKQEQWVLYGHSVMRYVIHPRAAYQSSEKVKRKGNTQNCYRVTAAGEVHPGKGYPSYAELFGRDAVHVEFRCKGGNDPWVKLADEEFRPHEMNKIEDRIRQLNAQENGLEYRAEE